MPGITHPRRSIHTKRIAAANARELRFSDLIGKPLVYRGPGRRKDLYPERVGFECRVVLVSETDEIAPLIVEFRDSFRGIAEREWLAGVQ